MTVFGREGAHPYDSAFDSLLKSNMPANCAMARNLMHDHRVSLQRQAIFDRVGGSPTTGADIERAVRKYFKERVRTRTLPDYVYSRINGDNFIAGKADFIHLVHPEAKLARVLDLNGLWPVFWWAKREKHWEKTFAGLRDPWDTSKDRGSVHDWLDKKLLMASEDKKQAFVEIVLDVLKEHRRIVAYQPAWATAWNALKHFERYGPERWLEAVGMTRASASWIVLLVYTFAEAGTVVRPTQLDADWYPYHFPSPPQAPLKQGGHPMDLRENSRARHPLPEYIHRQIDHHIHHFRSIGRTQGPSKGSLTSQRKRHHSMLVDFYRGVRNWMYNPVCPVSDYTD